jgi:mannose-6-phosphate isomerase-like protein (cupin superfamily)
MRQVIHDNKTYALILSADDFQPGVKFVSEPEWALQVGLLMPPAGHAIAAHVHLLHEARGVHPTQEFLFVISGRMEVDFLNEGGQSFHTETIRQGEALLQIQGGHAFRFPEETRLLEVKSGPYLGRDKDKVLLEPEGAAAPFCSGGRD